MSSSNSPTWHHANDNLRHESDETLHLKDIQAMVSVLSHIALMTTRALITTAAKGPFAIFRRGTLSTEKDNADIRILLSNVEGIDQFLGGMWSECIPHLRPVERDTRRATRFAESDVLVLFDGLPVGFHVCEFKYLADP